MLKKPIAILLLAVYLFNLAGYSLVFQYFIEQSEQQFAQQIDENKYTDAELVEISIPFNLPYTQNSTAFERLDGSIEVNGITYNYVKRRVLNDTLHILCLPNQQRTQLLKEKSSYAGQVNDFATQKSKEPAGKKNSPLTEYNNIIAQYSFALPAVPVVLQNKDLACFFPQNSPGAAEHPPQTGC